MKTITEYRTASVGGDHKSLDKVVNELIARGFQPLGGVSTCIESDTVYFTQAMVRYGKDSD